jgi:hypothetical protein
LDEPLVPEIHLAEPPPSNGKEAFGALVGRADDEIVEGVFEIKETPEVQELIKRCLDGTEPFDRDRKYWQALKFGPQHVNIAVLRAAGFKPSEIAKTLHQCVSHISVVLHHPYARKIIHAIVPENSPRIIDIRTRLEAHASALLDHMVDLALKSEDVDAVRQVGFGLLDRVGHGPVQKTINASVPASAFMEGAVAEHPSLGRLAAAMEESNRIDKEVMPGWKPSRPPEEGSLPSSEVGLGGPGGQGEGSSVPGSLPASQVPSKVRIG